MLLTEAQTYIAKIYGGTGNTGTLADAAEALIAAVEELQHRWLWSFTRQDTSQSFTVAACDTDDNVVNITTATTNGFEDVLVGMTVTGTGVPADTTVAVVNSTTSIDLSAATSGGGASVVCTFGGTIPIIAGIHTYRLPATFYKPYSCRLVSTNFYSIRYVQHNRVDLLTLDQTVQGSPRVYTIYNAAVFDATGTQQTFVRFFRTPSAADVALLKYYRLIDAAATTVDIPEIYLRTFLDLARVRLLETKDARNNRTISLRANIEGRIRMAISADANEGGEDQDEGFTTPMEHGGLAGEVGFPRGDYYHF